MNFWPGSATKRGWSERRPSVEALSHLLVLAEHAHGRLKPVTLAAAGFAAQVCARAGGTFDFLVLGEGVGAVAEALRTYGAARVLVADHPALREPLADKHAHLLAQAVGACGVTMVVAAASTYSKDVLPRAAALLDAGMLSEVVAVQADGGGFTFQRLMFAGNVLGTATLEGPVRFLTVRPAAFAAPASAPGLAVVEMLAVEAVTLPNYLTFQAREEKVSARPDATEARVVVAGGRALKTSQEFEQLVGGLADALGAAVGASRAVVDAGLVPNSLQIGQTGKAVAPELYVALGISGAIQHLAGMKDSRVIVAINRDPEAPIFEVADYGLIADIHQAVPELVDKLRRR